MDIIQTKKVTYKEFLVIIENHVDLLTNAYLYMYEIKDNINNYLTTIHESFKQLKHNSTSLFKPLHLVNTIKDCFIYILKEINIDASHPSNLSNTFLLDLESNLLKINTKFEIMNVADKVLTNKYITHILPHLGDLDETIKEFNTYNNTIELYAQYLQKTLNEGDDSTRVKAMDVIEKTKYSILSDTEQKNESTKSGKSLQSTFPLQRYNIIPVWKDLTEDRLLSLTTGILQNDYKRDPNRMYGGGSIKSMEKVSNILREYKIGLCFLDMGQSSHLFNFQTLMNKNIYKKYDTPPFSGVNDISLEKYNNIKKTGKSKHNYTVHRLGNTTSDKWIIVRTLNGYSTFDIMGVNYFDYYFNTAFIDKFTRGNSQLINNYQKIANNNIESFLKLPQEVVLNETTQLNNVSNRVIQAVIDYLDNILTPLPKNLNELYKLSSGDELEEIVSKILISSYSNESQDSEDVELLSTFLSNADYVILSFMKYIKEGITKYNFTELMFLEKTKNALFIYIRNGLIHIVKEAANKAFNPHKDIYEQLHIKKSLLKIYLR